MKKNKLGPIRYCRLPADIDRMLLKGSGVGFSDNLRRALTEWALAKELGPGAGGIVQPYVDQSDAWTCEQCGNRNLGQKCLACLDPRAKAAS